MVNGVEQFWRLLPFGPLRTELLTGSVGAEHLSHVADLAQTKSLAWELGLAAWEANPLDGQAAMGALEYMAGAEIGNHGLGPDLEGIKASWHEPESLAYYRKIAAEADAVKLERYLRGQLDREPDNLFWLWQLGEFGFHFGQLELVLERLAEAATMPDISGLMLRGRLMLMLGDPTGAEQCFNQVLARADGLAWALELLGQSRLLQGDDGQALECWSRVLEARPWHASLLAGYASVARGLHLPLPREKWPGSACVLLYSYNHGPQLDQTLESLARSDVPFILALDNGSSDTVPEVLRWWRERLGRERMDVITLPVNIGAPAARNYLMRDQRVLEHDFAVFLDDDALVPEQWLGLLMRAAVEYPLSHVWGCRVVDQDATWRIQSADLHLRPAPGTVNITSVGVFAPFEQMLIQQQPFGTSSLHLGTPDLGGFSHVRPCVSVTGCCHMFRTGAFWEHGGFDLRFTPSQYDDLERDLRLAAAGRMACCQGYLAVRHLRSTGRQVQQESGPQRIQGLTHRYTLYSLFTPPVLERIRDMEIVSLERELQEHCTYLDGDGGRAQG